MAYTETVRVDVVGQDKASAAFRSATNSMRTMDGQARRTGDTMRRIGATSATPRVNTTQAVRQFQQLEAAAARSSAKVRSSMANMGSDLAMTLGVPAAAAEIAATKIGMNFETAMSKLRYATKATQPQMQAFKATIDSLSSSKGLDPTAIAEGMIALGKSGASAKEVLAGIPAVLDLSIAGTMEVGQAADLLTQSIATFGEDMSFASQAADALAGAADASTSDVGDLAMALAQGSGAASAAGLSFKETTAILAAFAQQGLRGSDAGTSLKTMMIAVANPSAEAAAAMEKYNVQLFDAQGNMKNGVQIARNLGNAFEGVSRQERLRALAQIFGTDAMRGANALYQEGEKNLKKYTKATEESGTAEKAAKAARGEGKESWDKMVTELKKAAVVMYEDLKPALMWLTEAVSNVAKWFQNASPGVRTFVTALGAIVAAAGAAIVALGPLITSVSSLWAVLTAKKGGDSFRKMMEQYSPGKRQTMEFDTLRQAANKADGALVRFLRTAARVGGGLASVVSATLAFSGGIDKLSEFWGNLTGLTREAEAFGTTIKTLVPGVGPALNLFDNLNRILAGQGGLLETLKGAWGEAANWIGNAASTIGDAFGKVQEAYTLIQNSGGLTKMAPIVVTAITDQAKAKFEQVKAWMADLANAAKNYVVNLIASNGLVRSAVGQAMQWVNSIRQNVVPQLTVGIDAVRTAISTIYSWLSNLVSSAWEIVVNIVPNISAAFASVQSWIGGLFGQSDEVQPALMRWVDENGITNVDLALDDLVQADTSSLAPGGLLSGGSWNALKAWVSGKVPPLHIDIPVIYDAHLEQWNMDDREIKAAITKAQEQVTFWEDTIRQNRETRDKKTGKRDDRIKEINRKIKELRDNAKKAMSSAIDGTMDPKSVSDMAEDSKRLAEGLKQSARAKKRIAQLEKNAAKLGKESYRIGKQWDKGQERNKKALQAAKDELAIREKQYEMAQDAMRRYEKWLDNLKSLMDDIHSLAESFNAVNIGAAWSNSKNLQEEAKSEMDQAMQGMAESFWNPRLYDYWAKKMGEAQKKAANSTVEDQLNAQLTATTEWTQRLLSLKSKLSEGAFQQLVGMGPTEGNEIAKALIQKPALMQQFNAAFQHANWMSKEAAAKIYNVTYSETKKALENAYADYELKGNTKGRGAAANTTTTINVNVKGVTDPGGVAREIQRLLNEEARRNGQGGPRR